MKATAITTATTSFQTALNNALGGTKSYILPATIATAHEKDVVFHFGLPDADLTSGVIPIYARLSASLLLDSTNKAIGPDYILASPVVGEQRCLPSAGAGACSSNFGLFWPAVAKVDAGVPPMFFGGSSKETLYNTCYVLRYVATGELQLSTLDALLTRWAALKVGNVYSLACRSSRFSRSRALIRSRSSVVGPTR